ncbi:hypothetical protein C8J57DRAFT_1528325 [Mycena rebaudengoi]|nr:hypothetical protein C8J57DRAFT_1528325 [Mycena rebaudengoi]
MATPNILSVFESTLPMRAFILRRNWLLTFPIICANIKTDTKKLSDNLVPFHILEKWDIDVVSVITPDTKSVHLEPYENTSFLDPIETIQKTIDTVRSTTNITRIIALSHVSFEVRILFPHQKHGWRRFLFK